MNFFIFISNYLLIEAKLPFEIIPNHLIKRANKEQIERIQNFFVQYGHSDKLFYGFKLKTSKEQNSWSIKPDYPLTIENSRYYIIEAGSNNFQFHKLQSALWLCKKRIHADITFGFVQNQLTGGGNFVSFQNYFSSYEYIINLAESEANQTNTISEHDLLEIRELYNLITTLDKKKFIFSGRAVVEYNNLKSLPIEAEIRKLIYFIIWESLLTHKPDPKDPTDSITRQLKGKISLVNNRLEDKIDLHNLCGETKLDTIIKALYNYRSDLIHTGYSSFIGKKSILKNKKNVELILDEITTKLIKGALREPQLIYDLKKC
mgnify:CR=1 FL=1